MFIRDQIIQEINSIYSALDRIGNLGESKGFLRAGYSSEESEIMKLIADYLLGFGFKTTYDQVGNFIAEYSGKSEKFIEVASHVDSVPGGGNFDGIVGVVSGAITFAKIVKHFEGNLPYGLRLRIWRLEESGTYKSVYTGSRAAFGKLDPKFLEHAFDGITLRQAITESGYDVSCIEQSVATITQAAIDNILAHIEIHIEQGNVLIQEQKRLGLVTAIRGNQRLQISFLGRADHSGATPMGKYRRDSNLALCHVVVGLSHLLERYQKDFDIVQTVGDINSDNILRKKFDLATQQGMTKVAGAAFFLLDIRSTNENCIINYTKEAKTLIKKIALEFNVDVLIEEIGFSKPVAQLDLNIISIMQTNAKKLGISYLPLASGAGHDALVVAQQKKSDNTNIPVAMIFIPCKDGVSHSPLEYSSPDQICDGIELLFSTVESLLADKS